MKRVVNKLEKSKVEVICDVEEKVWKEAQEKAFKKLAKNLELKGFRKGSVPEQMARKHIDQGSIFNEGINSMLQPAFEEVLKEEKLQPFARPSVDVTKVSDTELQLKFIIVLAPEVKLGTYKGLAVKKAAVSVTEKEVKEAIDKLVAQNASLTVKEGPAAKGDTVVMDFVGSVDGKEFEGGKADNYSLELGSNQFVPGFEDQLVGHKAGEEVEVNVTFPEQYVPELAGKKALFKCTVHEVKEKVTPTLDEELIKELNIPDVKDEASLKEYEKKTIKASKEAKAQSDALNEVLENAKLEGVNGRRELFDIILPMIWPTLTVSFVGSIGVVFTLFVQVQLLTGGSTGTQTIAYLINSLVGSNNNVAATMGIIFTVVAIPIILLVKKLLDKLGKRWGY